ncbi:MAG: outer membrane protein assembly factor BamD [Candidatus Omnitrophica bacterium]|nr:outer membrane protein assembly factor BamD [Candidatus Omnitrophota bacterium]MDE2222032.1 outer membrane protein assembly factor BamD [Candidatus Omnitrophota bacterium]
MKLYVIILSLLLQGVVAVPCVRASEAGLEWQEAVASAKQGEYDFAFMGFHSITHFYPDSRWAPASFFGLGEYFFLQKNFSMAAAEFENFYKRYPKRQESLIALVYLYKIAQIEKKPNLVKKYRHQVASFRQLTFIFNERKYFKYFSAFQRKYKLVYYINKVGLYVNGGLFTEVPF